MIEAKELLDSNLITEQEYKILRQKIFEPIRIIDVRAVETVIGDRSRGCRHSDYMKRLLLLLSLLMAPAANAETIKHTFKESGDGWRVRPWMGVVVIQDGNTFTPRRTE